MKNYDSDIIMIREHKNINNTLSLRANPDLSGLAWQSHQYSTSVVKPVQNIRHLQVSR